MICIDGCGFQAKPENLDVIKSHVEECLSEGACRTLKNDPVIVWRNGQLTVAEKAKKNETTFPVVYNKKTALKLDKRLVKTAGEVAKAKAKAPNITQGTISSTQASQKKKRVTKKASELEKETNEPLA